MDVGDIAEKAQDALSGGRTEKLVRDNAGTIEAVVKKVGDVARSRAPPPRRE